MTFGVSFSDLRPCGRRQPRGTVDSESGRARCRPELTHREAVKTMCKVILLAVDARHYAPESVVLARELAGDTGDKVIVLHVHEFAIGRFGRLQVDCPEGEAERLVTEILADLRNAGVAADSEIRRTQLGHIARVILETADEHDARVIIVGSSGRTDLPTLPFGSVSNRLLHLARRPVMVVPRQLATEKAAHARAAAGHAHPETVPG